MEFHQWYRSVSSTSLAGAILVAVPAHAQQAAPTTPTDSSAQTIPDIVVTAEKRSTNLQRTPVAVTALSGKLLEQQQVRTLKDMQALVPNFKMGDAQGIAQLTIRGIGSTSFQPGTEGAVAVNLNDVYVSRPIAQQAGLYDVAAIEVLRGPQGTLFGRNATAGAVDIATSLPSDQLSGYGRVTVGNYGTVRLEGAIGGPIADGVLSARIAGFRETHDGYGKNLVTGTGIDDKNAYGVRGTIVFKPTSSLKATLFAEYFHENDHSGAFHYFGPGGLTGLPGALGIPPLFVSEGGYSPVGSRDIASGIDPIFKLETKSITGVIDWSSGPFGLKSITGYRRQSAHFLYSLDGGSTLNAYEISGEPAHQISEEFQAHYDVAGLHLTAGGYYFNEHDNPMPQTIVASTFALNTAFGIPYPTPGFIRLGNLAGLLLTRAAAGFGQATYNLTAKLSVTAGIRYSWEKKHLFNGYAFDLFTPFPTSAAAPPFVDVPSKSFRSTTPKVGINYQVDPTTLVYLSYSKGFKSGGFDTAVANPVAYLPEKLTDYEAGLKTTLLNGHLRANIAGFYYNYTNLQVQQVVGLNVQTGNAAAARVYGIETEWTARLSSALELNLTASWNHARYGHYVGPDPAQPLLAQVDFSGNRLNNAPDYSATLAAQYTIPLPAGSLILRGQGEYSSRFYFAPDNLRALSQGAYVKGDLSVTYQPIAKWELTAFIKNIANAKTRSSALIGTTLVGSPIEGSYIPPRLFGMTAQYKF